MDIAFHEAANIFPMDDEHLDALAGDIKLHGLLCPVELADGKIIDGRRRFLACRIAGVEVQTVAIDPPDDPIAYVLSLNLHRRHLTPSQLSMVAARAREVYDHQAKERQKRKPKSVPENLPEQTHVDARDAAGKAIGVSGRSVDFATIVLEKGTPELVRAVDEGRIAVSSAAVYANQSPEKQLSIVNQPKRKRKYRAVGGKPTSSANGAAQPEPGVSRGVGVQRAHEAIACLKRIPKRDALRKRGFQIVTDWIRHNNK